MFTKIKVSTFISTLLVTQSAITNTLSNKTKKLNISLGTPVIMTWAQLQFLSLENREKYLVELQEALAHPFTEKKTSYEVYTRGKLLFSFLLGSPASANDREEQSRMLDRFEAITRELTACGSADATNETVSNCRMPLILERADLRKQWDAKWSNIPRTREAIAIPTERPRPTERPTRPTTERVARPTRATAQINGTACTFSDTASSRSFPGLIKDGACVKAEDDMECLINNEADNIGKIKNGTCDAAPATSAQVDGKICAFDDGGRSVPGLYKGGACVKAQNGMDCLIGDDANKPGKFLNGSCQQASAAVGGNCVKGGISGKFNKATNTCDTKKDFNFCGVKLECEDGKALCNPVLYGFDLQPRLEPKANGEINTVFHGNFPEVKTYDGENQWFVWGRERRRRVVPDDSTRNRVLYLETDGPAGPRHRVYNKPICVQQDNANTVEQNCWVKAQKGHLENTYSSTRALIDMMRHQQIDSKCRFEGKLIQEYWNDWAKEVNDTCKNSVVAGSSRDYDAQINALNPEEKNKHYACVHVHDRARKVTQSYTIHANLDAVAKPIKLNTIDTPVRGQQ